MLLTQPLSICRGLAVALLAVNLGAAVAGCGKEKAPRSPSVTELQEDPIRLSGELDRCNKDPSLATTRECLNARAAVERREGDTEAKRAAQAQAKFEQAREQRRLREEQEERRRQAAPPATDPYTLPVDPAR